MEIVTETGRRPQEETHWAIDTFFRNSDMLRLLASAKYLPDLRDVSRLASTNARTREVLSGSDDLALCRKLFADEKAASLHTPYGGGAECYKCSGESTLFQCRCWEACFSALYENGNLRVARTFKAAVFSDDDDDPPPLESGEIDYFKLLGNGHFDVAIELAKTATNVPTFQDCTSFFKYIIWGLPGDTDEDTVRLAGPRLLAVRAAFPHLGVGPQNIAMMQAMQESAYSNGVSGPILSAIEQNFDTLERIYADADDEDEDEDSDRIRRHFIQELVYSSFSPLFEGMDDIGKIGKRNGSGLGYLLRTARCNLSDLASIFRREIRGNWEGQSRKKDKGFEYAERARRMLKAVYTETADLNLDWRGFFLSPDMTKALEWILQKTAFSPLIAEHMEQRDQTARELLSTERKEGDSEEADKRERRFADAFIASLKLRRAPDRLLEFVATVIRDGLPLKEKQESPSLAGSEPPTKRHRQ